MAERDPDALPAASPLLPPSPVLALVGERDATALVAAAIDRLLDALQAQWAFASASGESSLAGLRLARGDVDIDLQLRALGATDTGGERALVRVTPAAAAILLSLPQHTTVVLGFGPPPLQPESWIAVLEAAARILSARLGDLLELARALLANAALERRISDLSLLFKGLDVTLSSVELRKVLRAFLTCVTSGEAIGFNRAFLLLLDEDQRELRGVVAVGPSSGEEASTIWNSIEQERPTLDQILRRAIEDPETEPLPGSLAERIRGFAVPLDPPQSLLARAVTATGSYNIHRYSADDGPEPFADAFGATEFVVIPIQGRERTLGVIVADNLYSGTTILQENAFLLSGLANHVGVVIENALMFEDVSRRYDELSEVQYINRALLSSMDYGEVLHQIAQISASMLRATGTLLFIVEGAPAEPRLAMQYTADGPPLLDAAVARCTDIAREALERHAGVLMREVVVDIGAADLVTASLLGAPMQIDNEAVGVLVVYRTPGADPVRTVRFDRHSQRFLSIIADQAAIAVLSGRRLQTIREDQRQIQQLNEVLYRNEKLAALGEASSKIAHEIRNPLTALGGFARRLLKSGDVTGKDREGAEIIVRETARLERILNDQLAFVRSARLQLAPTRLNPLVRDVQSLLRHQFEVHRATLRLQLDPNLPEAAVDGDRIKQVLVNLLMNALEAVDAGGIVQITTRAAANSVELEVANTGAPIAPEVAQTLFMPFTTTKQEGTGLGMAVVHQIVTEHGGTIHVRAQPPWGGLFSIRLPVQRTAPAPTGAAYP
jgi:signal transduction histidine kinase